MVPYVSAQHKHMHTHCINYEKDHFIGCKLNDENTSYLLKLIVFIFGKAVRHYDVVNLLYESAAMLCTCGLLIYYLPIIIIYYSLYGSKTVVQTIYL